MWKPIPDWEGYEASSQGDIRSIGRTGSDGRFLKAKLCKSSEDKYGYLYVQLTKDGVAKKNKVHRLVCAAFQGVSDLTVNHIDENKHNNKNSNLEYRESGLNTLLSTGKHGCLIDPNGTVHNFYGIADFCRTHKLDRSSVTQVMSGRQEQTKGWKLYG